MTTTERARAVRTAAQIDGSGQVLRLVRRGQATTITELASAMGVARSTILQRLEFLSEIPLIESVSVPTGSRGRPAATLRFNPLAGVVLAAHAGLTGVRTAVTDLSGHVIADQFDPVDLATGPDGLVTLIDRAFQGLLQQSEMTDSNVVGIGFGTPSSLELKGFARSLGLDGSEWDREFFHQVLTSRYRVPVFLDLDVNMLAIAEHRTSWPDAEVVVCVKLGTLIDASLVVRGTPIRGASNLAGELGHLKLNGCTTPCECGNSGCLDAEASGSALVRQLQKAGIDVDHISQVVRLADQGLPEAIHALREAGRHIGEALSSVVNLLNPAVITTWGYLTASDALFAGIREALYGASLPRSGDSLQLVKTSLGDLAGVRGAAMHAIDEVLDPSAVDRALLAQSWTPAHPS